VRRDAPLLCVAASGVVARILIEVRIAFLRDIGLADVAEQLQREGVRWAAVNSRPRVRTMRHEGHLQVRGASAARSQPRSCWTYVILLQFAAVSAKTGQRCRARARVSRLTIFDDRLLASLARAAAHAEARVQKACVR
jgi:hypothetical protein